MKLAVCLALFVSAYAVWGQDAPADPPPDSPPAAADSDAPAADQSGIAPATPPDFPWKPSLDVEMHTNLLVPVFDSGLSFKPGGTVGAELAFPLPDKTWHIRTDVDVGSLTMNGQWLFLATVKPGLSYDAFFGPTAFMTFEVEGGWLAATATNFAPIGNKPCVGAGTSFSFYAGDHLNFVVDVRYLEVFNAIHLVTFSMGFNVIGN